MKPDIYRGGCACRGLSDEEGTPQASSTGARQGSLTHLFPTTQAHLAQGEYYWSNSSKHTETPVPPLNILQSLECCDHATERVMVPVGVGCGYRRYTSRANTGPPVHARGNIIRQSSRYITNTLDEKHVLC